MVIGEHREIALFILLMIASYSFGLLQSSANSAVRNSLACRRSLYQIGPLYSTQSSRSLLSRPTSTTSLFFQPSNFQSERSLSYRVTKVHREKRLKRGPGPHNSPLFNQAEFIPVPADPLQRVKVTDILEADRPFSLPPGEYRPKQSLGQNFLSDQNYVLKICDSFQDSSEGGNRVVEIGPGAGALTRVLYKRYPAMTAIEVDQRSVAFLEKKLPGLKVIHQDVLKTNWSSLAESKGGKLRVIGNMPYNIVSQVMFSLADYAKSVEIVVFTMQLELAERVCAPPNCKSYGIPSVVFQLYAKPKFLFKIPPTVFYPKPDVMSALVQLDFTHQNDLLFTVQPAHLKK